MGMCRVVMTFMGIAMRMGVRISLMIMAVFMLMSVTVTMFCYTDIEMSSLLTHCNVQHSVTGNFGDKFKVEHALTVRIDSGTDILSTNPEQRSCLTCTHWLEIGQRRCVKSNTSLLAGLKSLVLHEKLGIMRVSSVTVSMEVLFMHLGTLLLMTRATAQDGYRYKYKKYISHSNQFKTKGRNKSSKQHCCHFFE
jgi:hypothetical protein